MVYFDRLVDLFLPVLLIVNAGRAAVVPSSPKFDETGFVGSSAELRCPLTDSHSQDLNWRKVQGKLSDDSYNLNGVLTFGQLTLEDDGFYECVSVTDQKVERVYLTVLHSTVGSETLNPKYRSYVEKNAQESAVLYCEFTNEPNLKWRRVYGSLPRFKTIYGEPDNRLYLHYVSEADSGDYECYLPDGRSSTVHLNVKRQSDKFISNELDYSYGTMDYINYDAQPKDNSPPTTKIPSSDSRAKKSIKSVDAELYSRVSLFCDLSSTTETIQWKKINGSLSTDSYSFHQQLLISNINEEDFGTYECSVHDGSDSMQRRELIQLNKKPSISSEQTDVAMIEQTSHYGEQVDLVCQPAELFDQVTWKRLNFEMPNERVEIYGNVLTLSNVNPSDSGVYECNYGNDNKYRVKLVVHDLQEAATTSHVSHSSNTPDLYDYYGFTEPTQDSHHQQEPQVNIRSSFLNAKEGENIENVCSLTSNLDSSVIEWYNQYNEPVEKDERFQVYVEQSDSLTSLLRIYPARKEDSGRYECRVRGTGNVAVFDLEVHEQYLYPSTDSFKTERPLYPDYYETSPTTDFYYRPETERPSYPDYYETAPTTDFYYRPETERPLYPDYPEKTSDYYYRPETERPLYPDYYETAPTTDFYYRPETERPLYPDYYETASTTDFHYRPETERPLYPDYPEKTSDYYYRPETERPNYPYYPETTRDYYYRPETERPSHHFCDVHESTCRNGQCIPRSALCDGKLDCTDGSDENCDSVSQENSCQPNEKSCRSGGCVQKIWLCDGENDCKDGSDEENCPTYNYGEMCRPTEFQCSNHIQCISKGFMCDKTTDCTDNSDEIGCVKPSITLKPVRFITVRIGATFQIECHASGFPKPFINWRLNWGHVCEEPRCNITNSNGIGILIVSNARITDAGAYSCEAINANGREFAVPDTIVEVINDPVPTTTTTSTTTFSTTTPTTTTTSTTTTVSYDDFKDLGCNCHNHAEQCTCSGKCYNCQHNTYGDRCQFCLPGYYGDATRGTPFDCSLYPTTTTTSTTIAYRPTTTTIVYVRPIERDDCHCNGHSYECTCSGYCLNCQHNTDGKYCHECKPGYEGDPLSPQGCHKRIGFLNDRVTQYGAICNPHGTAQESAGSCICKSNVVGKFCDQCAAHSFNLVTNHEYKRGCLSCFCNGLEVQCQSSNLVYEALRADFETESHDWSIGDKFTKNVQALQLVNGGLEYSDFNIFQDREAFFIAPDKFKGNKLSSYGGNITIKLKYSTLGQDSCKFELRLSGSHVNIVYLSLENLIPNVVNEIVVPLYEDEFKRYGDNGKVNREHMLMALSDIKLIMIRANYSPDQYLIHLNEFGIDVAQESNLDNSESRKAKSVETCECPVGYSGNSCENCAQGFKRSISGFYLGLCEPEF